MSLKPFHQFVKDTFGQDLHLTPGNDFSIFSDIIQITTPKNILETGFFKGGSAFMLLHLSTASLTSVDPMKDPGGAVHEGSLDNVGVLMEMFRGRFTFLREDSRNVRPRLSGQKFDLFNIDGDHTDDGATNDFQLAIDLEIPWIVVDDFILNLPRLYRERFYNEFFPVRSYFRDDQFEGRPIPRVLMRRRNPALPFVTYPV